MFFKLTNLLKLNYILKNKKFIIHNNKNNLNFLKIFLKLNIIKTIKINNKYIVIYLQYYKNSVVFSNITNVYKPSNITYVSLEQIIKINKKKNNIFILSTNKGLITNFEAEKYKIGGTLITKIII